MITWMVKNFVVTLSEYKKEIIFLCLGMILSLFLLFQTVVAFFSNMEAYGTGEKQKELESYNIECFEFHNKDNIKEMTDMLMSQDGIKNVSVEAHLNAGRYMMASVHLPEIVESDFMTTTYDKDLKDGEIITDYNNFDVMGSVKVKRQGKELALNGYTAVDDEIVIGDYSFCNKAEISVGNGDLVTINDFANLMKEYGNPEMMLSYEYEKKLGKNERERIAGELRKINPYESSWGGVKAGHMDWGYFVKNCYVEIAGTLLAVISTISMFVLYIRKRLKVGAILKLQGVTNTKLMISWILEFVLFYFISSAIAIAFYYLYMMKSRLVIFDLQEVVVVSTGSLFLVFLLLQIVSTVKYVKMQPFEMYTNMK